MTLPAEDTSYLHILVSISTDVRTSKLTYYLRTEYENGIHFRDGGS